MVIFGGVCGCAVAAAGTRHIAVTATAAVKQADHFRILLPSRTRRGRNCLVWATCNHSLLATGPAPGGRPVGWCTGRTARCPRTGLEPFLERSLESPWT